MPQDDIVRTVLRVMLPFGTGDIANRVVEAAAGVIWDLTHPRTEKRPDRVTPSNPEGCVTVGINASEAIARLRKMIEQAGYCAPAGEEGTITDLSSTDRLELTIRTATELSGSYGNWKAGMDVDVLIVFPCVELLRVESREVPRGTKEGYPDEYWQRKWAGLGGKLYKGRMVCRKDDPIMAEISDFGVPYGPPGFNSGYEWEDVRVDEAEALGAIRKHERVKPQETQEQRFTDRLAAKLRLTLSELETDLRRRLADPLAYGTGDDLLDLAESKLDDLANPTPEQVQEVKTLLDKAIERGVDEDDERVAELKEAIAQPGRAQRSRQEARKEHIASLLKRAGAYNLIQTAEELLRREQRITPELVSQLLALVNRAFEKGAGEKHNLRARGHKVLASVCQHTGDTEKAEATAALHLRE